LAQYSLSDLFSAKIYRAEQRKRLLSIVRVVVHGKDGRKHQPDAVRARQLGHGSVVASMSVKRGPVTPAMSLVPASTMTTSGADQSHPGGNVQHFGVVLPSMPRLI